MLDRAIMEIGKTTSFGQDLMEEGRRTGLDEGRREGLETGLEKGLRQGREEARQATIRLIRRFLERTFPELAAHPAIDQIPTLEKSEQVLDRLYGAKTERASLAAITGKRAVPAVKA